MLINIRVENFKAFQDTGDITLAPLTLLAGVNSAGKSSIIQALLLLKQTLESGSSQVLTPGKGPWLEQTLGDNFNDFIFGRPALDTARLSYHFGFQYAQNDHADLYTECQTLLASHQPALLQETLQVTLQVTFGWGAFGLRGRPTVRVSELSVIVSLGKEAVVGLRVVTDTGDFWVTPLQDATHPALKNLAYQRLEIDGLSNFLPDSLIINPQQPLFGEDIPPALMRLFRNLFAVIRRDLGEQIYYLSSLRSMPIRFYMSGQTAGLHLLPNGSNFAEVLWRFKTEPVRFIFLDGQDYTLPLPEMTARVLAEVLCLPQAVQVRPVGEREDILEVIAVTLGAQPLEVTLADIGLGYNQVLPIIVQGLLTPPGGLFIFEQPEIHLHPDVQAKLVPFFVGLARSGRRVLVETHSGYMVDALCLAIAQDASNWLAENAQTLFVHAPDADHAGAWIEPVKITPYGEILNWPPHFLPDVAAVDEAILKAGFAKRRALQSEQSPK